MRPALLAMAGLLLGGCISSPWQIDDGERIDAILARGNDPADAAAHVGIPVPHETKRVAADDPPPSSSILDDDSFTKKRYSSSSSSSSKKSTKSSSSSSAIGVTVPKVPKVSRQ